ncbi:RagB/SusD family nutrient uptake outer membrane protein, partial [uncultured Duncaniella sp.]
YPIILLEKAEAEARTGNITDALASLNTLRKYRYSGSVTDLPGGSSFDQDQLLNEILNERRREQHIASFQRTVDLKRYAFDNGKPWSKQTIVHRIGDKEYSAPISSPVFNHINIDNAILKYNPQWGIALDYDTYAPYDKL